jgi:hypothetical protein
MMWGMRREIIDNSMTFFLCNWKDGNAICRARSTGGAELFQVL